MDKIFIDNSKRAEVIELPNFGEVKLIVKKMGKWFNTALLNLMFLQKNNPKSNR